MIEKPLDNITTFFVSHKQERYKVKVAFSGDSRFEIDFSTGGRRFVTFNPEEDKYKIVSCTVAGSAKRIKADSIENLERVIGKALEAREVECA
jgi:hypothetical protein